MHCTTAAITELGLRLPRIAEEGQDVESTPEVALAHAVSAGVGGASGASAVVMTVRRIFESLSLLDSKELSHGRWQFVSFPALLIARSLLAGLGDDHYRLLDIGFWDASDQLIDRQRELVRKSERRRLRTTETPPAIRRVWVAWALMSLDGRFLVVRREDPDQHRDGSGGTFVLPGGRVSSQDMAGLDLSQRLDFFDPAAQLPDVAIAGRALERALFRELHEELELDSDDIRSVDPIGQIIVYDALEGAKSAHAFTHYRIQLFRVALTGAGKTALLSCLARQPGRFSWFSADELLAGTNARGETAFVDALKSKLVEPHAVLNAQAHDLGVSTEMVIKEPLEIPSSGRTPLLIGKTGNERSVTLNISEDAFQLLGLLAAARRDDPVKNLAPGLSRIPVTGWILASDSATFAELEVVAFEINRAHPSLLSFQGRAIRLNTESGDQVHFGGDAVSIDILDDNRGKSFGLRLSRCELSSRFGTAPLVSHECRVPSVIGTAIYDLFNGDSRSAMNNMETVKRMQRSGALRAALDAVGASLLIRQVDGVPELTTKGRLPTP